MGANKIAIANITYATSTGSLRVTVSGLGDVDADITVTGPNGFSQGLLGTTLLTNLVPGDYAIVVNQTALRSNDPTVSDVFELQLFAPNAEVNSGETTFAGVPFDKQPGSGRLWVPNTGNPLLNGYTSDQLAVGGTPIPDVALALPGGEADEVVAFDGAGNAWVTNSTFNTPSRFAANTLAASASVTADITIGSNGTSLDLPAGLAFDAAANLWVAAFTGNRLEQFSPAQLATSGSPTPDVIISSDGTSLILPCGTAFDADGNLWVTTNSNVGGTIQKFTPAQLASSGSPTPDVTISSDDSSLLVACGIAFG